MNKDIRKSISSVIDAGICTGCGSCSNICPKNCITTRLDHRLGYYVTSLDDVNCVDCGLCQNVCPVFTWDNSSENPYVGSYKNVLSGFSNNDTHRVSSASGGITTSILAYLLESGNIDAAVVAVRSDDKPLESELRIFSTIDEILNSRGSVYSPTSYTDIISEIKKSEYSRFAIVGLPCHIEGITNLCKRDKILRDKIRFKISLVCGHTPSIQAYIYSFGHLKIDVARVRSIKNRGDGWPGYMTVSCHNGSLVKIKHGNKYSWGQTLGSPLFTPPGCKSCSDPTGYNADISISDAWLPRYMNDSKGRNLMIVRSPILLDLLMEMSSLQLISLYEESIDDFIYANQNVFKEKLYINSLRNKSLSKRYHLYPLIKYQNVDNCLARLMTHVLFVLECLLSHLPKNDFSLFVVKAVKYLSLKWIRIKNY